MVAPLDSDTPQVIDSNLWTGTPVAEPALTNTRIASIIVFRRILKIALWSSSAAILASCMIYILACIFWRPTPQFLADHTATDIIYPMVMPLWIAGFVFGLRRAVSQPK